MRGNIKGQAKGVRKRGKGKDYTWPLIKDNHVIYNPNQKDVENEKWLY